MQYAGYVYYNDSIRTEREKYIWSGAVCSFINFLLFSLRCFCKVGLPWYRGSGVDCGHERFPLVY